MVQPAGGICVLLPSSELRETTTTTRLCVDSGHNAVNTPICSQTFVKMRPPLSLTGFVFLEKNQYCSCILSNFCHKVLKHLTNFTNLAGRLTLWVEPANLPVLWEGLWRRVVGFLRLGQPRWVGGSYWWRMPMRTAVGWQQRRYLSHNKLL